MDISKITDEQKLKALAYDQVLAIETAQANLRALQSRILELSTNIAKK